MITTIYDISGRQEAFPAEIRNMNQFQLSHGVDAHAEIVLGQNWSLYCLDIAEQKALFVELPEHCDLATVPFVYAEQFNQAQRAAVISFDVLTELADKVQYSGNIAMLMSTGRCGSTLASRIFANIPGVWSLSEPDWLTNLALARFELGQEQTKQLIHACTKLTCRPYDATTVKTIVIKPRSEMLIQAQAYIAALPEVHSVFLYRDCFGYVNSLYKFAQRLTGEKDPKPGSQNWETFREIATINAPRSILDTYFLPNEDIQLLDLMVLSWALRMTAYINASDGGMTVIPLHYDDLTAQSQPSTKLLLESCGIDTEYVELALHAFTKDAHTGSAGENSVAAAPISAQQKIRIEELVKRWGISDFVNDRLAMTNR